MKLVSFVPPSGSTPTPGLLDDSTVYDLGETPLVEGPRSPLGNVIERVGQGGKSVIERLEASTLDIDEVSLKVPVPRDGRVICLGGVYAQHLRERGDTLNRVPSQWIAPDSAVIGEGEQIVLPERVHENVMPAVELGVVIGSECKHVSEAQVQDAIAGYTVCNDVTARTDWPGPMAYKLMDTFWPVGPSITLREDVQNVTSLAMHLEKDGKRICSGTTASMRFSLPFIVSYISSILRLRPGDVISAGDPGNVEESLEVNTTITATIEEVGSLSNPVVKE